MAEILIYIGEELIKSLDPIINSYHRALRPLETFKPHRSRSESRLINTLRVHLFEKYRTPKFLIQSFLDNYWGCEWYFQWGAGISPRKFSKLPFPLTKAMAHLLQFAPADLDPNYMAHWAFLKSIGMENDNDINTVLHYCQYSNYLNDQFRHEDKSNEPIRFWMIVMHFLVRHETISVETYPSVLKYVFSQKYSLKNDKVYINNASYTMKGRTPNALLRQTNAWLESFEGKNAYLRFPMKWKQTAVKPFLSVAVEGSAEKIYSIEELCSQRALFEEGQKMKHCVFSYVGACATAVATIWSMEVMTQKGDIKKLLTIELSKKRVITQVLGKQNRRARRHEKEIIQKWANENGLELGSSIYW